MPIYQRMFSRSLHRTNPASVAALLIGIALVPVSVGAAIVEHDRNVDSRQKALESEAGPRLSGSTPTIRAPAHSP